MGEIKRAAVASTARSQRPRSVMEACSQPDASTAAIARLYKLNADVVDRWRADRNRPAWIELNGRARYRLEDVLAFERAPLLRP